MQLGKFFLEIPEGRETAAGYVEMTHGAKYTLKLSNLSVRPCDCEVDIDGSRVGVWRIPPKQIIFVERPVHDTGRFTFYRFGTADGKQAGLVASDELGLVTALFKPEGTPPDRAYSLKMEPGGTGLSGHSGQKFKDVSPLDYDESQFIRIHLRLACANDEARPLVPSTPVPPPLI